MYKKTIIRGSPTESLYTYPVELLINWGPMVDLEAGIGKKLADNMAEIEARMILNGVGKVKTVMNLNLMIDYVPNKVGIESLVDQISLAAQVAVGRHDKKSRVTVMAYDTRLEVDRRSDPDSEVANLKAELTQARSALKEANDGFDKVVAERDELSKRLYVAENKLYDLKYKLTELSE